MEGQLKQLKMKQLVKALKVSKLPPDKLSALISKTKKHKGMKDDLPWVHICKSLFSFAANTGDKNVLHNMSGVILLNLPTNFEGHANKAQHLEHAKKSINSLLTHIACNLKDKEMELRAELIPVVIKLFAAMVDLEIQMVRPSEEDNLISRIRTKEDILFGNDTESYLDALLNCKSLLYKSLRKPSIGVPLIKNILERLKERPLTPPMFLKSLLLGKIWLFMTSKKELHKVRDKVERFVRMPPIFVDWAFTRKIDWLNLYEWSTKTVMKRMTVAVSLRTLYGAKAEEIINKHNGTKENVKNIKHLGPLLEGSCIEKVQKKKRKEKQHENVESVMIKEISELQEICRGEGERGNHLQNRELGSGAQEGERPSDEEVLKNSGVGELLDIRQKSQPEASKGHEVLENIPTCKKKSKRKKTETMPEKELSFGNKSDSACTQDQGHHNGRGVTKKRQRKWQEVELGVSNVNGEASLKSLLPTSVATGEVLENEIAEIPGKREISQTIEKVTLTHRSQVAGKEEVSEKPEPKEFPEASLVMTEENVHDVSHREGSDETGDKRATQRTSDYSEEEIDTKIYSQEEDGKHEEVIIIKKRKIGKGDKAEVISETRVKNLNLLDFCDLEGYIKLPINEHRQKPSKEEIIASRKRKRKNSLTFTVTDIDSEENSKVLRDKYAKDMSNDFRCRHDVCLDCSLLGKHEQSVHNTPCVSAERTKMSVRNTTLDNVNTLRDRAGSPYVERKKKSVCTSTDDLGEQISESQREVSRSSFISKSFEDLAADVSKGFDISKLLPGNIEISRSFSKIRNDTSTINKATLVPEDKMFEKAWCNIDPASVLAQRNVTISSVTVSRKDLPKKEVGFQDKRDCKGHYQMSKHNLCKRYDSSDDEVGDDDEDSSDSSSQRHPQHLGYLWQNEPGHSLWYGKPSVEINSIHCDDQSKTSKDRNMMKECTDSSSNTHKLQPRLQADEEPELHKVSVSRSAVPPLPTRDSESDIEVLDVIQHTRPIDSHSSDDIDEAVGTDGDVVPCDEDHEMFTSNEIKLYHEKLYQVKIKEEEEKMSEIVNEIITKEEAYLKERKMDIAQRRYSYSDRTGTNVYKTHMPAEKKSRTDPVSKMMNQLYKKTSNTTLITENAEVVESKCKNQEPEVVLSKEHSASSETNLFTEPIFEECQEENLDTIYKSIAKDTGKAVHKFSEEIKLRVDEKMSGKGGPKGACSLKMDGHCDMFKKVGVSSSSTVDKEVEGRRMLNDPNHEGSFIQSKTYKGNNIDSFVSSRVGSSNIDSVPKDKGSNECDCTKQEGIKVNITSSPVEKKVAKENLFSASTSGLEQKGEGRDLSQVSVITDANEQQEKMQPVNEFNSSEECTKIQKEVKELIDKKYPGSNTVINNTQENDESNQEVETEVNISADENENSQFIHSNDFDKAKKVRNTKDEKDVHEESSNVGFITLPFYNTEPNDHDYDASSDVSEEQWILSSILHKKRKSYLVSPVSHVHPRPDVFTSELDCSLPQKCSKKQDLSLNKMMEVNREKHAEALTSSLSGKKCSCQKHSPTPQLSMLTRSSLMNPENSAKVGNIEDSFEDGPARTRLPHTPSSLSTYDPAADLIADEAKVDYSHFNDSMNLSVSDSEVQMQTKTARILRRKTKRSVSCVDILSSFAETAMETDSCNEDSSIDRISESLLLNAQADVDEATEGQKFLITFNRDGAPLGEQSLEINRKLCVEPDNSKSLRSQHSVQSSPYSFENAVLPTSTPKRKELSRKSGYSQNQVENTVKNDKVSADSFIVKGSLAVEGDEELEVLSAPGDEDDQHISMDEDHVEETTEIHVAGTIVPYDDVRHHTCHNCKEELTDKASSIEGNAAIKARLQPVEGWQCAMPKQTSKLCVQDSCSPNGIPQLMPYKVPKEKLQAEVLISPEVSDEECEMVSPSHDGTEHKTEPKDTKFMLGKSKTSPGNPFITHSDSQQRSRSSRIRSPQKLIPEEQDESTPVKKSSTKKMKSSELSGRCGTDPASGKGRRKLTSTTPDNEKCERLPRNNEGSEKTPNSIKCKNSEGSDQALIKSNKSQRSANVDNDRTPQKQQKKDSGLSKVDKIDATFSASSNLEEGDTLNCGIETGLRTIEMTPKRVSPRLKYLASQKDMLKSEGEGKESLKSNISSTGKQRRSATSKQQGSNGSNRSTTIQIQPLKRNIGQEKGEDTSPPRSDSVCSLRVDSKGNLRSQRKAPYVKGESQTPRKSQEIVDTKNSDVARFGSSKKHSTTSRTQTTSLLEEVTEAEKSVQLEVDRREKRNRASEEEKDSTKVSPRRLTTRQATLLVISSPAKESPSLEELHDGESVHNSFDRVNIGDKNADVGIAFECQSNDAKENGIPNVKTSVVSEENEGKSCVTTNKHALEVSKVRELEGKDSEIYSSPLKNGFEICSSSLENDSEICYSPLSKAIARLRTRIQSKNYASYGNCKASSNKPVSPDLEERTPLINEDKRLCDNEDLDKEAVYPRKCKSEQAVSQGKFSFEHVIKQEIPPLKINTDESLTPNKCNSEQDLSLGKDMTQQAVSQGSNLAQVGSSNLCSRTLRSKKQLSYVLDTQQTDVSKDPNVIETEKFTRHGEEHSGCIIARQMTENGMATSKDEPCSRDETSEKDDTGDEESERSIEKSTRKEKTAQDGALRTRSLRFREITYSL